MGSYSVIEEVSNAIVELLREKLVPEFVEHQEEINLSDIDKRTDYTVAISLYDIQECNEMNGIGVRDRGMYRQMSPSLYLNLYYVINVQSQSDEKFRVSQEQTLLGRILQIIYDEGAQILRHLEETGNSGGLPRISLSRLSLDEKLKIIGGSDQKFKSALYYEVSPVELVSLKEKKIKRVTDMEFTVEEKRCSR